MRKRGITAAWAVLLALGVAIGGCDSKPATPWGDANSTGGDAASSAGLKRVILLNNGADPYWDAMRAGMLSAEKDFKLQEAGLKSVMDVNDATAKGQIDKLRQYANQTDVAAVAVSVTDALNPAIANAMRSLGEQGIKVIAIDCDTNRETGRDARFAYLGTDNIVAGQELGKAVKGLRPEGGKYATFVGLKSAANAIERIKGFGEGAGETFTLAESLGDEFDKSAARKNVQDALDRNPDITTLVGIYAYNAHAIAEVVKERDLKSKITVAVFDGAPLAIADMEEGLIDVMILQNPYEMGYLGTRLMKALVTDDQQTIHEIYPAWEPAEKSFTKPSGDLLVTGLRIVVPDQGSKLTKDIFAPGTEFMKLSELKAWLKKYDLTGT